MEPAVPVLDLLSRQQPGIGIGLDEELVRPLTLKRHPYHFCAINGYSGMAAFLHQHGVSYARRGKPIRVMAFFGAGVGGSTPWEHSLEVSPVDAAQMAGHAATAQLLQLIEQGVPLGWSRKQHHRFPASFRREVRVLLEALVSSPAFAALPGPARVLVIDKLVTSMARRLVYDKLPAGCTSWACTAEREYREVLARQRQRAAEAPENAEEGDAQVPIAELGRRFQMTRVRRHWPWLHLLRRGSVAVAAVQAAWKLGLVTASLTAALPAAAIAGAAFLAPAPALLALAGIRRQLQDNDVGARRHAVNGRALALLVLSNYVIETSEC